MDQTQPPPFPGAPAGQPNPSYYYMPPQPPPPAPSGRGWGMNLFQSCLVAALVTLVVPVLLIAGFFILMATVFASGVSELDAAGATSFDGFIRQTMSSPGVSTRVVRRGDPENTIALVTVHGEIDGTGSPLESDGMLAFASAQLKAAREDNSVKAVILQIDSPGGGLTASDQIYHEVERLAAEKPVLAWAGALMASGGYYIAAAADEIMANPTSTIGSIGVMLQHVQARELLEKIGVAVEPVTSGEHKDLGSPFREMTPEERDVLQKYVDASYERFVEIVAKSRNLPPDKVKEVANGDIFNADTAKTLGLVDEIGYMEDAVAWAEEETGEHNMRILAYGRTTSLMEMLMESGAGAMGTAFQKIAAPDAAPKMMAK